MNFINKKNCLRLFMTGSISLLSLPGFSIKAFANQNNQDKSKEPIYIEYHISNNYDYCSAYKAIDNIKKLILENQVKDVYINIDIGKDLNDEEKDQYIKYVEDTANKLKANKIKFTLIGQEWQLDCFHRYDSMLICDDYDLISDKIEEFGKVYYDGHYYNNENDEVYINDASGFIRDEIYQIKRGDTLKNIADYYEIDDYESLARYNNIDYTKDLTPGTFLIIPSKYNYGPQLNVPSNIPEKAETLIDDNLNCDGFPYKRVDENLYYKGIDVSEHQGQINWDIVKDKVDFAIIRMADTCRKDSNGNIILDYQYRTNMQACQDRDIPMGVYLFTRAHTEEEMQREIDFVLNNLTDEEGNYYNITRPIYLDVEENCGDALFQGEEARQNEIKLIKMFCDAIEEAGFTPGIYLNSSALPHVGELINNYSIWTAGGKLAGYLYNLDQTVENMYYGYHSEFEYYTTSLGINVVQTSSHGSGSEVGVGSTFIDLDYADKYYFDYLDELYYQPNKRKSM